ncbi:MAG: DUF1330 domain-containing protein [Sneathiella sp.]|nr:DUF1330 domain-containing protein [Sneathiella sp.]
MKNIETRLAVLINVYGEGADEGTPTKAQWRHLLETESAGKTTLINFFKMRDTAEYPGTSIYAQNPGTGEQAFMRYAEVSVPTLEKVGGNFLLHGPFDGMFTGDAEDWDVIVVGTYPNRGAVLALFENADYQSAFVHRSAACSRQKVFICGA